MTTRLSMAEHIHQLTSWHTHREPYEYDSNNTHYVTNHVTQQPPLLAQLDQSVTPASQGGEIGAAAPGSRPAANLDALAAAADIDLAASRWVRDLGEDDPLDTIACIRRLHGLSASADTCDRSSARRTETGMVDCCTWHAIEADVRRWWTRARVLTGWDSGAWKPDATCPLCGDHRSLVIHLSRELATCTNCLETWDEENIGLLADHIRDESEAARFAPKLAPIACAPVEVIELAPARIMLCPDCGSRNCIKAQEQLVGRLADHQKQA